MAFPGGDAWPDGFVRLDTEFTYTSKILLIGPFAFSRTRFNRSRSGMYVTKYELRTITLAMLVLAWGSITLSGCGGGGSGSAEPSRTLSVSPSSISLSATLGEGSSAATIGVSNSGGGSLSYQVSTDSNVLSVSPASGAVEAGGQSDVTITLNCESPGTFSGTISVAGAGSTRTVSVTAGCERPKITLEVLDRPVMGEGEPRRRAGSSFRWRISSSWMDQPAVEYLIRTDREGVTTEPSVAANLMESSPCYGCPVLSLGS